MRPDLVRFRRLRRMPLVSPRLWLRRAVFWAGAVLVSLVAIVFAKLADGAAGVFAAIVAWEPLMALLMAPAGFALAVLATQRLFPGAQGSGIPQVMAVLHLTDTALIGRILSKRVAAGKVALTLLGLGCGASIGREGPTVQVGASVMQALGGLLRLPRPELQRALVLAGGAAGVSAAFNTPLAGIVFAIEELAHSFESRASGTVLTAVIISGACTLALVGNYSYFGSSAVSIDLPSAVLPVLVCGVAGGLLGGAFSSALLNATTVLPGRVAGWFARHPLGFAGLCGLGVALIGLASGGATYGTGYEQASGLVAGHGDAPWWFFLAKLAATVLSYISGIPGGIFAPSLSVGAGLGHALSLVMTSSPAGVLVLLSMAAYFAGVVQAPITATIIVMEMTQTQRMTIPLLAVAMLAFGASRLVCRRPLYGALAARFLRAQVR